MVKIEINISPALKKRMDALNEDWNKVAVDAFKDLLKRAKEAEKTVDKSSYLRTRLFRIPKKTADSWSAFFNEKPKKKPKRKPF